MRLSFIWLSILLVSAACETQTTKHTITVTDTSYEKMEIDESVQGKPWLNAVKHIFSDPIRPDSFVLELVVGPTLGQGQVRFEIFTAQGRSIYRDTFAAHYLAADYDDDTTITAKSKIKKRFDHFFDADRFLSPAIKSTDTRDTDYAALNIDVWQAIRNDRSSIGFTYLIGEENNKWIAYSKKLGRVVMYMNCC